MSIRIYAARHTLRIRQCHPRWHHIQRLDDVMANWIFLKGIRAYTAKCDIRYKNSLPTGTPVRLEANCKKERGRLVIMQGKMIRIDTDELVAETEASFMKETG